MKTALPLTFIPESRWLINSAKAVNVGRSSDFAFERPSRNYNIAVVLFVHSLLANSITAPGSVADFHSIPI
jgi:hypothetical protein